MPDSTPCLSDFPIQVKPASFHMPGPGRLAVRDLPTMTARPDPEPPSDPTSRLRRAVVQPASLEPEQQLQDQGSTILSLF